MNDQNYRDFVKDLKTISGEDGWYLVKEHHPWGYYPEFKNSKTHQIVYRVDGMWYASSAMREYVLKYWRPVSSDDRIIYRKIQSGQWFSKEGI